MNRRTREAFRRSVYPIGSCTVPEQLYTMSGFLGHIVIPMEHSDYLPTCSFVEHPSNKQDANYVIPLFVQDTIEVSKAEDAFNQTSLTSPTLKKVVFENDYWYVGHGIIVDSENRLLYLVTLKIGDTSKTCIFINSYIFNKKKDKLCKFIITHVLSELCCNTNFSLRNGYYCMVESLESFFVTPRRPYYYEDFDEQVQDFLVEHVDNIVESLCNFVTFEENS